MGCLNTHTRISEKSTGEARILIHTVTRPAPPPNGLNEELELPLYLAIMKCPSSSFQKLKAYRKAEEAYRKSVFSYHLSVMMSSSLKCHCRPRGEPEFSSLPCSTEMSSPLSCQQWLNGKPRFQLPPGNNSWNHFSSWSGIRKIQLKQKI